MIELFALFIVLYLGWNIGGNDVANSFGSVYGSKTLGMKHILVLAAVLEFLGVVLFSDPVAKTMSTGLVAGLGATAFLLISLVAALWLTFASFRGMPISATQAMVGALLGLGIASGLSFNWGGFGVMVLSWLLLPFIALLSAGLVYVLVRHRIGARSLPEYAGMYRWFAAAQVFSACLLAFAHGSNDGGMVISMLYSYMPDLFVLKVMGGFAMAVGILMIGSRVISTVGNGITFLTPLSGFVIQLTAGLLIILASLFGIPVSTTHIVLGALIGVGLLGRVNWHNLGRVMLFGMVTLPLTAAFAAALMLAL